MTAGRGAVERRPELLAAKLTAVASACGARPAGSPVGIGIGAAVVVDTTAWVLVDGDASRGLGAALAWALRRDARRLVLVADDGVGVATRRAAGFRFEIAVHGLDQLALVAASPAPHLPPVDPSIEHLAFVETIEAAGAIPVVEHGVVAGEVLGLEVCRVVDDAVTGSARLEVGVGAHDRETFQMVHGERPTVDALREVVAFVTTHRRPGGEPHPLRRLAASRLLRSRVIAQPGLLGDAVPDIAAVGPLVAAAPPVARVNVKDDAPCVATTLDRSLTVVCSAGVDLDAVPFAVDAARRDGAQRCIVAVAQRDAVDIQRRLAAAATVPTTIVGVND